MLAYAACLLYFEQQCGGGGPVSAIAERVALGRLGSVVKSRLGRLNRVSSALAICSGSEAQSGSPSHNRPRHSRAGRGGPGPHPSRSRLHRPVPRPRLVLSPRPAVAVELDPGPCLRSRGRTLGTARVPPRPLPRHWPLHPALTPILTLASALVCGSSCGPYNRGSPLRKWKLEGFPW